MSRNEMFFLLACAVLAAIMSTDPVSPSRQPPVTIVSLLAPPQDVVAWNQTELAQRAIEQP